MLSLTSSNTVVATEDGGVVNAEELLARYENTVHPDAEVFLDGTWLPIERVCTDLNDESVPIFIDIAVEHGQPARRELRAPGDDVEVRGLVEV